MTKPRCFQHKDAPSLPRLCHTCQRIAVEQEIVTRTVDALLAAGYLLQTDINDDPRPEVESGTGIPLAGRTRGSDSSTEMMGGMS